MKTQNAVAALVSAVLATVTAETFAGMREPGAPREPHPSDASNTIVAVLIFASITLIGTAVVVWITFWGIRKFREHRKP